MSSVMSMGMFTIGIGSSLEDTGALLERAFLAYGSVSILFGRFGPCVCLVRVVKRFSIE
jgi:hypothetical protein